MTWEEIEARLTGIDSDEMYLVKKAHENLPGMDWPLFFELHAVLKASPDSIAGMEGLPLLHITECIMWSDSESLLRPGKVGMEAFRKSLLARVNLARAESGGVLLVEKPKKVRCSACGAMCWVESLYPAYADISPCDGEMEVSEDYPGEYHHYCTKHGHIEDTPGTWALIFAWEQEGKSA